MLLEIDHRLLTATVEANEVEGVQLLVNSLLELPREGVFAILPPQVQLLPRQKKMIPKMETRWERFAKAKGIHNRKKIRVEYDEQLGDYRPRYGYKSTPDDWIKEVPVHGDQAVDLHAAERQSKKDRIAKNNMQQKRNLEEALEKIGKSTPAKQQIKKQIIDSKISTASLGKFDRKIENDNVKIRKSKQKVLFVM